MADTAALPEARKKPSKKLIGDLLKRQRGLFEPLRHHGEWFYPHWSIYALIMGLRG